MFNYVLTNGSLWRMCGYGNPNAIPSKYTYIPPIVEWFIYDEKKWFRQDIYDCLRVKPVYSVKGHSRKRHQ